jgi:lysophospholipase L1-like esterase
MTEGGSPGFGAYANKNAVGSIVGYSGVEGILVTIGTNDWANPGASINDYIAKYKSYIQYCRGLPQPLPVVVLSPIWRTDHATAIPHSDGWIWTLEHWRYFTESLAYEEAVKPGTFVTVISGAEAPLLPQHFVEDQIHLNASGHEVLTTWLIKRMQAHGYWL